MAPTHRAVRRSGLLFSLGLVALAFVPGRAERSARCPEGMAPIAGLTACIDRYEASLSRGETGGPDGKGMTAQAVSRRGVAPAMLVSQLQARAACERAGKHLCTRPEWTAACRGQGARRKYPYGARYEKGRCHNRALSLKRHTQYPLPTGSMARCRTPDGEGVYDLSGNVWEWLADTHPDGETASYVGGGFGNDDDDDNLSCTPEDPLGQPVTQQIEGLGFRCCAALPPAATKKAAQ